MKHGKGILRAEGEAGENLYFEGEFNEDKRHGKVEEMSATRESDQQKVTFKGTLDEKEIMNGYGVIEAGNQRYTGELQLNQFNGQGKIEYLDTGNVFKGQFALN